MKLITINESTQDITSILDAFINLDLLDAPTFKIGRDIQANDVDKIDGRMDTIPICVVSYDTMQKYIVPRNDDFLIPVPKGDNWAIQRVSHDTLQQIIETLGQMEASLDDFYNLADKYGNLFRMYY